MSFMTIEKQVGKFKLDENACYEEMKEDCVDIELFCSLFKVRGGKLRICGGEDYKYKYIRECNIRWLSAKNLLKVLARSILKVMEKHFSLILVRMTVIVFSS